MGIAQALLNDPQVLIVDEPTVGLDPAERVRFRNLLTDLAGERIVLLSTHIVSDVGGHGERDRPDRQGQPRRCLVSRVPAAGHGGKGLDVDRSQRDLPAVKTRHVISSTVRQSDGIHLRVVAEAAPDPSAQPTAPTLEDAYLHHMAAVSA